MNSKVRTMEDKQDFRKGLKFSNQNAKDKKDLIVGSLCVSVS